MKIELEQVSINLGGIQVLDRLDLTVNEGQTLVIMGRSGAGKSVILKHIIGLMMPDAGRIYLDGMAIDAMSRGQLNGIRKRFGMLFQSAALFDSMNVRDNVSAGLRRHRKLSQEQINSIVAEKLAAVGLEGVEEKMPADLSGGMRKRVGLARAIAMDPEVILYDEPTTGLDPITADQINDLIVSTGTNLGVTSIVVTHDVASALKVGTDVALLFEGRIIFRGPVSSLEDSDNGYLRQFLDGRAEGPMTTSPSLGGYN